MSISDQHAQLCELAYHSWLRRGCPEGSPEVDWANAEQELQKLMAEAEYSSPLTAALSSTDRNSTAFGSRSSDTQKDSTEDALSGSEPPDPEVRIQSDSGLSKNVADTASSSTASNKRERSQRDNTAQKSVSRSRSRGAASTDSSSR